MSNEIMIAVCSLIGTLIGSLGGIMASNKLTNYRIQQLEQKVEKHNNLVERMAVVERDMKTGFRLINELREEVFEHP